MHRNIGPANEQICFSVQAEGQNKVDFSFSQKVCTYYLSLNNFFRVVPSVRRAMGGSRETEKSMSAQ